MDPIRSRSIWEDSTPPASGSRPCAYASRAFALYYMLQCSVATLVAHSKKDLRGRSSKLVLFGSLTVICFLVFVLGLPSE